MAAPALGVLAILLVGSNPHENMSTNSTVVEPTTPQPKQEVYNRNSANKSFPPHKHGDNASGNLANLANYRITVPRLILAELLFFVTPI